MDIKRRNFIQFASLSLATILTGFKLPDAAQEGLESYTKRLHIQMPYGEGKYIFYVDGKRQLVDLVDGQGKLFTPVYSCEIMYLASDGETDLIVHIEEDTTHLHLWPGISELDPEMTGMP